MVFVIETPFNQRSIMKHYDDGGGDGLCSAVSIEYGRHHITNINKPRAASSFATLNKVVKYLHPNSSDSIKKLKSESILPSDNFLDRIKGFQDYLHINIDKTIYRTREELGTLLDNADYQHSKILYICLTSDLRENGKIARHAICIKIDKQESKPTIYTIFDPNHGETIPYYEKSDCLEALNDLKLMYLKSWQCKSISMRAADLEKHLNEIGIIPIDTDCSKAAKYNYKIFEAIKNKDLKAIHGELGSKAKLDYTVYYDGKNPIKLAIKTLDEADLIKLIDINTKMDLSKSIFYIVISLVEEKKLTSGIIDALIRKAPEGNPACKQILEDLKSDINSSWLYKILSGVDCQKNLNTLNKHGFDKYIEEYNSYLNSVISSQCSEDTKLDLLYMDYDYFGNACVKSNMGLIDSNWMPVTPVTE